MVVLVNRRLEELGVKIEKYNDTGSSIETNLKTNSGPIDSGNRTS
jgi:hypothetical protein